MPKGRKDGRISKASETQQLPPPTFNISQLQQSFSQRGLSLDDLVALSGKHTLLVKEKNYGFKFYIYLYIYNIKLIFIYSRLKSMHIT